MDISADLTELSRTPITVISAGVKSILDIGRTLEYLVGVHSYNERNKDSHREIIITHKIIEDNVFITLSILLIDSDMDFFMQPQRGHI